MTNITLIRSRLQEAIRLSGVSQKKLAETISVSPSCIAHYMRGDIMPALDTFANLCVALDADPAYLLGIKDE